MGISKLFPKVYFLNDFLDRFVYRNAANQCGNQYLLMTIGIEAML